MNWAVEHEIPTKQKASHAQVDYEHPSKHPEYRCGNCQNYIPDGPRCRTVEPPIRPMDWCLRYKAKESQ